MARRKVWITYFMFWYHFILFYYNNNQTCITYRNYLNRILNSVEIILKKNTSTAGYTLHTYSVGSRCIILWQRYYIKMDSQSPPSYFVQFKIYLNANRRCQHYINWRLYITYNLVNRLDILLKTSRYLLTFDILQKLHGN